MTPKIFRNTINLLSYIILFKKEVIMKLKNTIILSLIASLVTIDCAFTMRSRSPSPDARRVQEGNGRRSPSPDAHRIQRDNGRQARNPNYLTEYQYQNQQRRSPSPDDARYYQRRSPSPGPIFRIQPVAMSYLFPDIASPLARAAFIASLLNRQTPRELPMLHHILYNNYLTERDINLFRGIPTNQFGMRDQYHRTGLHIIMSLPGVTEDERCMLTRMLLSQRVDPYTQDDQGLTALHMAVAQRNYAIVNIFLTTVRDPIRLVNTPDNRGITPLHIAILNNDIQMIIILQGAQAAQAPFNGRPLRELIALVGTEALLHALDL